VYFADEPDHVGMLREQLRRFVAEELPAAKVRQWDREHRFPLEVFTKLAGLGVCGLTIDEAHGGQSRDLVAAIAVIEELCDLLGMPIVGGSSNMQKNNIANRLGLASEERR